VPFVAQRDAEPELRDQEIDLRAEAVDPVPRASQLGRHIGAGVVGDLPERETGEADVDDAVEPGAGAALDLEGVAAADVDPVFSEVEIVAEERRCADLALAAQEVRAAQRELVGPESPPDAAAPRLEAAGGSVEGVRRHEVRVGEPRADHEGLDEEVAESGPVD